MRAGVIGHGTVLVFIWARRACAGLHRESAVGIVRPVCQGHTQGGRPAGGAARVIVTSVGFSGVMCVWYRMCVSGDLIVYSFWRAVRRAECCMDHPQ
jgi:hypothetical protein